MDNKAYQKMDYALCLLSAAADGRNHGCIVNSFHQVTSSFPPKFTVAVNKDHETCKAVQAAGSFSVTLLDADAGRGVEPLEPDVTVPQTLEDALAGRDSAVEWLLSHPEKLEWRTYPDAPLTRGRFVGLLYEAAGSPAVPAEASFPDLLGIEWYLPAVNWAAEAGITTGTAEGTFSAVRPLTWQEAAVLLVRAAEALAEEPAAVRTAPLPDALADGAWDPASLEQAWRWGLLPEDADPSAGITRSQGAARADALQALL